MRDTAEILIVVSTLITVGVVIFAGLLAVAGSFNSLFNGFFGYYLYLVSSKDFLKFMFLSMVFSSMLGPPLSWGAALLSMFNSNWWLNNYIMWYLAELLGILSFI
ncbi:MAG: hypothetical protein Q6352_001580 [Candidatus Freyrarchaeum guaymaensis]|nr:hypothetical protein [Candidatus Sigynarchaeota archaeon]